MILVTFYCLLDFLLFGEEEVVFFLFWLEEVELSPILHPYGYKVDEYFLLVFLLLIILNVKELFSLVEVVLFNFILSDRSFLFKWSWISYYICFLGWRVGGGIFDFSFGSS